MRRPRQEIQVSQESDSISSDSSFYSSEQDQDSTEGIIAQEKPENASKAELEAKLSRSAWWLKKKKEKFPHAYNFDLTSPESKFKFGVLGIFNTKPEGGALYRVTTEISGKRFDFSQADWNLSTSTQYLFAQ